MIPNINMWVNPETKKLVITFRFDLKKIIDRLNAPSERKEVKDGAKD